MKVVDPSTPAEWQDAADAAEALLLLDSCRQYGLITGGPGVNQDRAVELLERAKRQGIVPIKANVESFLLQLYQEVR